MSKSLKELFEWFDAEPQQEFDWGDQPRWIPVTERLPNHDESTDVLVTCVDRLTGKRSVVEDCYFYGVWCSMSDVIAWMPLPEPYKEVKKDD